MPPLMPPAAVSMRAVPELGPLGTRRSACVLQELLPLRTHRFVLPFGVTEVLSQSTRRGVNIRRNSHEEIGI